MVKREKCEGAVDCPKGAVATVTGIGNTVRWRACIDHAAPFGKDRRYVVTLE